MLLIDTYVGPSAIEGVGVFAAEPIRAGQMIYRFAPEFDRLIALAELDSLDLDTDLDEAVVVVEWGEGVAERLSDSHLDIRLERAPDTETRTAIWNWSRP